MKLEDKRMTFEPLETTDGRKWVQTTWNADPSSCIASGSEYEPGIDGVGVHVVE
jgi:hypothetical protein